MKNLTYMPFKKNRYFTGKLLTSEDFEQEQQYLDDKRRLLNRWVVGAGIVAGLEVIRVDDYHISIEMGMALDYTGREIVVDTPVIRKLSEVEGYEAATSLEGAESVYLCIEYDQIPAEPVHNITNRSRHIAGEESFSKYKESYRLFATDDEPDYDEPASPYERAEHIRRESYRRGVYLARIELVKAGEFYMIEKIILPPEPAFVGVLPDAARRLRDLAKAAGAAGFAVGGPAAGAAAAPGTADGAAAPRTAARSETGQTASALTAETDDLTDWQFAQGQVSIPVPERAREGHCLYSEEIAHGLGLGDVDLILHVRQGEYNFTGAAEIFPENEKKAEAAARLDRNMGTFIIGIRLLDTVAEESVTVGWTAIRKRSRNEIQAGEPRIFIHPGLVNARTREQVRLEAVCVNMSPEEIVWRVVTPEGGSIDGQGIYQAPNRQGVYEVCCEKRDQPQVRAIVYIVVRE